MGRRRRGCRKTTEGGSRLPRLFDKEVRAKSRKLVRPVDPPQHLLPLLHQQELLGNVLLLARYLPVPVGRIEGRYGRATLTLDRIRGSPSSRTRRTRRRGWRWSTIERGRHRSSREEKLRRRGNQRTVDRASTSRHQRKDFNSVD